MTTICCAKRSETTATPPANQHHHVPGPTAAWRPPTQGVSLHRTPPLLLGVGGVQTRSGRLSAGTGSLPLIRVPPPGLDNTSSSPPSAASRSDMFCSPEPLAVVPESKPRPLSVAEKTRLPSTWLTRTWAAATVALWGGKRPSAGCPDGSRQPFIAKGVGCINSVEFKLGHSGRVNRTV